MQKEKFISGNSEDEVWQQINADLQQQDILQYRAVINQQGRKIVLDIDIDLGGGFESGYATTTLLATIPKDNFHFSISKEGVLEEAGKLLGMQDVIIGNPEFDNRFLIRANDEARVKAVFSDTEIQAVLCSIPHFRLETKQPDKEEEKHSLLQLIIHKEITESELLRKIYHAFYLILSALHPIIVEKTIK